MWLFDASGKIQKYETPEADGTGSWLVNPHLTAIAGLMIRAYEALVSLHKALLKPYF